MWMTFLWLNLIATLACMPNLKKVARPMVSVRQFDSAGRARVLWPCQHSESPSVPRKAFTLWNLCASPMMRRKVSHSHDQTL